MMTQVMLKIKKIAQTALMLGVLFGIIMLSFIHTITQVEATAAGPQSPTIAANNTGTGTVAWSNVTWVLTNDNSYATVTLPNNQISNYLVATGFDFSEIPGTATILGITVEVRKGEGGSSSRAGIIDNAALIVQDGVISTVENKADTFTTWPTANPLVPYVSYGGSSDLWGLAWTVSQIQSTGFGFAIAAQNIRVSGPQSGANESAGIDHIRITVEYSVPITNEPPSTPTLSETPAFPNEETPDTTPVLGNFSAIDPEGDAIEYEIQWDEDVDFGSPVTRNTATFPSGSAASYTIQSGDALTDGQTYWWRVRARDPSGSNTWSGYSEKRSISINTSLSTDRWIQTTGDQFNTDTLSSDAEITAGNDGVKIKGW